MTLNDYAAVMLKGLGAATLTHVCSSVCRECGRASLAEYVELAGRLEILLLCLPLISSILQTAGKLLELV